MTKCHTKLFCIFCRTGKQKIMTGIVLNAICLERCWYVTCVFVCIIPSVCLMSTGLETAVVTGSAQFAGWVPMSFHVLVRGLEFIIESCTKIPQVVCQVKGSSTGGWGLSTGMTVNEHSTRCISQNTDIFRVWILESFNDIKIHFLLVRYACPWIVWLPLISFPLESETSLPYQVVFSQSSLLLRKHS